MNVERRLRVLEEAAEIAATALDQACPHQWWRIQHVPEEIETLWLTPEIRATWNTDTMIDLRPCTECDRPRAVLEWRYGTGEWLGWDVLSDGSQVPRCLRESQTSRVLISSERTRKYLGA
jgi:hypothetical protein